MNEFVTTTPKIEGNAKQRYSDFVVEEVGKSGRECRVERFIKDFEERGKKELKVPEKAGEHLLLDVEKVNADTNFVIARLARGLGVSKKRVGYAGLKDKRAITCQRMSIFGAEPERVERFSMKGIDLRNPEWSNERIELGDLKGNNFTITIRNLEKNGDELEKIFRKFAEQAEKGIPNFFGAQRFGGKRMVTHRVGKLLMGGKVEEAVRLYLTETFEGEKSEMKNARINLAKTDDYANAIKEFPVHSRNERTMIQHLSMHPKDFAGAFGKIPKKMKYFYTHAYQSWIFNKIIEKRLEKFGKKGLGKIDGDVLEDGKPAALLPGIESEFAEGEAGKIEKEAMEEEGVTFDDFRVGWMSDLSSKGKRKKIILFPEKMRFLETGRDEFNEGKNYLKFSFFLEKGNYATTVIRELTKEELF